MLEQLPSIPHTNSEEDLQEEQRQRVQRMVELHLRSCRIALRVGLAGLLLIGTHLASHVEEDKIGHLRDERQEAEAAGRKVGPEDLRVTVLCPDVAEEERAEDHEKFDASSPEVFVLEDEELQRDAEQLEDAAVEADVVYNML